MSRPQAPPTPRTSSKKTGAYPALREHQRYRSAFTGPSGAQARYLGCSGSTAAATCTGAWRQRPKARLVGQIVARRIIFRRGMSDDRDLAQSWKTGVKLGPRESEPSQRRGPTRRQQQIRRPQPVVQLSAVLLVLQVETHDLLSGAQVLVVAGSTPNRATATPTSTQTAGSCTRAAASTRVIWRKVRSKSAAHDAG
jgi:hypothetical protein